MSWRCRFYMHIEALTVRRPAEEQKRDSSLVANGLEGSWEVVITEN